MKQKVLKVLFSVFLFATVAIHAEHFDRKGDPSMKDFKVIRKPAMVIVGIECRTSNHPEAGPRDIPKLWQKFYGEKIFDKISNKASDDVIALYCDYEGDHTKPYSIVIGCPVASADQIPQGLVAKTVPASTFAVFRTGEDFPKSLIDTWIGVWQSDLNRTYTGDYELYGKRFAEGVSKQVDVWVAIEE